MTAILPKVSGNSKAEKEGDEAAERRASDCGGLRCLREGAIGGVDRWLEFFDEEAGIAAALAATELEVARWSVLRHAADAGVCDADEDNQDLSPHSL